MSRTRDMVFRFSRPAAVDDLIGALERCGWVFGGGRIRYLIDPDFFDWDESPISDRATVMCALNTASLVEGCGFQMAWEGKEQEASFLVHNSRRTLSLSPFSDLVYRSDVNTFINHEWYLSRTLPALSTLGLSGYEFQDLQD
ncbi:hypothetical protein ACFYZN_38105 [Streptomyces sp. NPDC001777]|uniref:hypothetical protein n=1 Tax=Streptomyces sp. NPDC001777 TaxID=3364608 RepID=UPI0036BB18A3